MGETTLSMPALKKRDDFVKRLSRIYKNNLGNSDVDFVEGDASFVSANVVQAANKTYTAPNVLIAVGGKPRMPEMPGIERDLVGRLLRARGGAQEGRRHRLRLPQRRLGDPKGARLGGRPGDPRPQPPPRMEPAVVDMLITEMEEAGIKFVGGESAAIEGRAARDVGPQGHAKLDGYDEVLFAIGRDPVTDNLNLHAAGIDVGPGGHVVVDDATPHRRRRVRRRRRHRQGRPHSGGDRRGRLLSDRLFGGAAWTCKDGLRPGADRRLLAPGDRGDGAH